MLQDNQKYFLGFLEQMELEISDLYNLFAEKFPSYRDFWKALSEEEAKHASSIKQLASFWEQGAVFLDEKNTRITAVKLAIDGIKTTHEKARAGALNLIGALAYSLSLENSLLEHKFYDFFQTRDRAVSTLLFQIKQETSTHAQKVQQALAKERKPR